MDELQVILTKKARAERTRELIEGCIGKTNNLALCVYNGLCNEQIEPHRELSGYVKQKGLYTNTPEHVYRLIAMSQDNPKNRGYKSDEVYNLLGLLYDRLSKPQEIRPELRLRLGELYTRLSFLRKLLKERKMSKQIYVDLSCANLEDILENPDKIFDIDISEYADQEREFRRLGETIPTDVS